MIDYGSMQMIPLIEVTDTIFIGMMDLPFVGTPEIAQFLDLEYFYNRSGMKVASPLVVRLSDDEQLVYKLAGIIKVRYLAKWQQMFARYSDMATINILKNIDVAKAAQKSGTDTSIDEESRTESTTFVATPGSIRTEVKTGGRTEEYDDTHTGQSTKSGNKVIADSGTTTENGSHTGGKTTTTSHAGTINDAVSETGTKTSQTVHSGTVTDDTSQTGNKISATAHTGKITDSANASATDSVYGFNSAASVPSAANSETSGNEREFTNTDTLTETPNLDTVTLKTFANTDALTETPNLSTTTLKTYNNSDTTTEAPNLMDTKSTIHGKSTTETYNNLVDAETISLSGSNTKTYNNEKLEVTNSGRDTTTDNKSATNALTSEETHSSTESSSESGYRYGSLIDEYMKLYSSDPFADFLECVYTDIDSVLTLPIFV